MNSSKSVEFRENTPEIPRDNLQTSSDMATAAEASILLEALLTNSLDLIYFKDLQSRFVRYSRSLALHFGIFDPGALKGKSDFDTFPRERAQAAFEDEQRVITTGKPIIGKLEQSTRADGQIRWFLTTKMPSRDAQGNIVGTFGISKDVTELKEMESQLAEAGSLLEALLLNSLDFVYFKDRQSRFIRYSRSMLEHVGMKDTQALRGKTDFDCYTEEHARAAFEDEQEIIRTGKPLIGKVEKETHPDGRTTWCITTKMPWHDIEGKILGVFGISKDITALKLVEAAAAETGSLLETLLENSPDIIYFKDAQSRFVHFSKAFAKLFNVSDSNSLRGKTDFDFFTKEHAQPAFDDELEIMRSGKPLIGKVEKETHPDGRITWCITTKMPWRDKSGKVIGTFGTSKDITALKESESKLDRIHKQLLATSRMAGMAEVATSVLHNVGNVLNSVNVSASLLKDHLQKSRVASVSKVVALLNDHAQDLPAFLASDPKGRQLPEFLAELSKCLVGERDAMLSEISHLTKNVDHIKEIVSMQQNYAKVSGVVETIKIPELVEDALGMNAGALVRHGIQLIREFNTAELPQINVDKHKVLQILVNLIGNAKYACDESNRPDKKLILRIAASGERVRITVQDNGAGIAQENMNRIFNHGFTTRKNGHGFGLHSGALAAKELGGSLTVHSDGPGTGAAFTLELPFLPPPSDAS